MKRTLAIILLVLCGCPSPAVPSAPQNVQPLPIRQRLACFEACGPLGVSSWQYCWIDYELGDCVCGR